MAAAEPTPPPAFVVRQVGHLLRRAYAIARRNSAEALSVLGDVSPVQAAVISTLAAGPMSQAELGRRIDMEPANTHSIVRRLVAAGVVELRPDPASKRGVIVGLTSSGQDVADRLDACLTQGTSKTLAPLDEAERAALLKLLSRLVGIEPNQT